MFRRRVTILSDDSMEIGKAHVEYILKFFKWSWNIYSALRFSKNGGTIWENSKGKRVNSYESKAIIKELTRFRRINLEEFYQITGQGRFKKHH